MLKAEQFSPSSLGIYIVVIFLIFTGLDALASQYIPSGKYGYIDFGRFHKEFGIFFLLLGLYLGVKNFQHQQNKKEGTADDSET